MTRSAGPSPAVRRKRRQFVEAANRRLRVRPGAARQDGGGRCRIATGRDQAVAHAGGGGEAHVDHDRRLCGSARPDQSIAAASSARCAVTNDRRDASLRNVRGRPASAAQPSAAVMPGTTTTGTPAARRCFELLAAAAEHERIAALEPHDALAGARRFDQAAIDLILADAALPAPLADEHALGIASRPVEDRRRDQLVVEHDVGILQRMQRTQRQEVGIARPGADQKHRAGFVTASPARARSRRRARPRPRAAAGYDRAADRSVHHALPEPAPRRQRGDHWRRRRSR